ncbi:MAG TPA: hypothetical protein VN843_13230, partial [Anaerolineales bacterium]|nr:hypothetical protein [Anaerolineales bacterium]
MAERVQGAIDGPDPLAGLHIELPITPPIGYPTTATFLRKLEKLRHDIEHSFLCSLRKVVAR